MTHLYLTTGSILHPQHVLIPIANAIFATHAAEPMRDPNGLSDWLEIDGNVYAIKGYNRYRNDESAPLQYPEWLAIWEKHLDDTRDERLVSWRNEQDCYKTKITFLSDERSILVHETLPEISRQLNNYDNTEET